MPPGKSREDTWKATDLEKSIRAAKDGKKKSSGDKERSRDQGARRERPHDSVNGDERKPRRKPDGTDDKERRERRDRGKENDSRRDRDRDHPRDKDRDRPRDKDRDRPRDKDRDREHPKDQDRDRPKDRDRDRDKDKQRRPRDDETEDDRRRREERRRRRAEDEDKERKKDRRPRDDEDDEKRRKRKEESRRQREEDGERPPRKNDDHTDDHRERRRKPRDGEEDEEERRKRHEEKKERRRKEREEQERLERERKKKEEEEAKENGDYDDYEDDFEDYEDDFDEDDASDDEDDRKSDDAKQAKPKPRFNSDVDEILQAMDKENERLLSDTTEQRQQQQQQQEEDKPSRSHKRGNEGRSYINFVSAKQRTISSKVASKARRRANELQQLIELDVSNYEIFDLPPVREYDLYILSFGSANTKQAYVQTNDDNIDREIQTEEIESKDKWSQHPAEDWRVCGGDDDDQEKEWDPEKAQDDMVRLNRFLTNAGQMVAVLLEEDFAAKLQSDNTRSQQSNIIVSDAFTELGSVPFLKGRPVQYSQFSSVQTQMLLTLYGTSSEYPGDALSQQGCLCVWNVNDPSRPQKILMCESEPRCCCFSPTKTTLAFAGMTDGSIVVWDLREPSSMHKAHGDANDDWLLRYPTYSTAGVLQQENHHSAILAIMPIVAAGDSASASMGGLADTGSSDNLSFQIATLEENATVHLWVVAEINNPDPAGSESDLGLSPGGRVKLVRSSTISLQSPLREARLRTTMRASDMQLLPSNNSHFYVCTDTGCVLHGVRYGGKAPPRAYRPEFEVQVQVTSLDFSPFSEPVFLAGCADGSLRLYHADSEYPLISWLNATEGVPIQTVRWCRSRPSVFFVLDTTSHLHIWDLSMDDSMPLKSEVISNARVSSLSLSNDHSATGLGLPGRRPQMFVSLDNGTCEVHNVSQQFSAMMAEEVDKFAALLQVLA